MTDTTVSATTTVGRKAIDHTPDEDEFQMTLLPETKIIFMGENIGIEPLGVNIIMHNDTPWMQAFKVNTCTQVKCTANYMFTIRPSNGVIASNEKKNIRVTFKWKKVPRDDVHFISFYHVHVENSICAKTPREMLETYRPEGVKRIHCQFKYANGLTVNEPDPIPTASVMINPLTGAPVNKK
ncbi:unnamed protein product [Thelazia callipaeda]|uniref:Major sperm protein n=1 Tax=Thelazia callipaeda TaxID=103827 RepID=A0A0N5CQG1_THECL|nr:unnamed protein product [Thelazia callipaeda]